MIKSFAQYFLTESAGGDLPAFLKRQKFVNSRSKGFLYHGTNVRPDKFDLRDDWEGDSGNVYDTDLPEGYLFLTDDLKEAQAYGKYVIPCELRYYSKVTVKVNSNAPSREFDDDFMGYSEYGMWTKFVNSDKAVLEVKGYGKSTFITDVSNVIPRVDLAKQFYGIR